MIQKSELKTKKQDRTIKESELKTNRHTIGRYKNRNLTSTDCIVRYNRKIDQSGLSPTSAYSLGLRKSAVSTELSDLKVVGKEK